MPEIVPAQWDVSRSHQGITRIEVWRRGGEQLTDDAEIIEGEVTDQYVTGIRRNLSMTVPPTKDWLDWCKLPALEIRPYAGLRFGKTEHLLPMGRFPVSSPSVSLPASGIRVAADDYWSWVVNRDFMYPFTVGPLNPETPAYQGYVRDVMAALIANVELGAPINTATSQAVMLDMVIEGKRSETVIKALGDIGAEAYFDRNGVPIVRDRTPVPGGSSLIDGEGGTLIEVSTTIDWSDVYNEVAVTSSNLDTPFHVAIAIITDPAHPAYWANSAIGHKGLKYDSALLSTYDEGMVAAQTQLAKRSAAALSWEITAVPDPSRNAGDLITATCGLGTYDAVIQSIKTSLIGKAQTMTLGAVSTE